MPPRTNNSNQLARKDVRAQRERNEEHRNEDRMHAADFALSDSEEAEDSDDEDSDDVDEKEDDDDDDDDDEEQGGGSESDRGSEESDGESDSEKEEELKRLMKDLAQVPLGDLAAIQKKIGMKAFKAATARAKEGDGDESDSSKNGNRHFERKPKRKEKISIPKREGKNRPVEMTAKKQVGRFRQVVEIQASKRRDPRFENTAGVYNPHATANNYAFLDDYRKSEKSALKTSIAKEKDADEKTQLRDTLTRIESQERAQAMKDRDQKIKRDARKKEADLVKQGKTPFFLKKSEHRKLRHIDQFKKITETGGGDRALEKFMEKKRKRNAQKEKRHLPNLVKRSRQE